MKINVTSILTSDLFSPKQNDYQNKGNFDHFFRTQQKPGNIPFTKAFHTVNSNRIEKFFNIHQNNWSAELILNKDDVNASNILVKKKSDWIHDATGEISQPHMHTNQTMLIHV